MKVTMPKKQRDILEYWNHPDRYLTLPSYHQNLVKKWILANLLPHKKRNLNAFQIKHLYENETGNTLFSGEFAGALLDAGFEMKEPKELWHHREFYCCLKSTSRKRKEKCSIK